MPLVNVDSLPSVPFLLALPLNNMRLQFTHPVIIAKERTELVQPTWHYPPLHSVERTNNDRQGRFPTVTTNTGDLPVEPAR